MQTATVQQPATLESRVETALTDALNRIQSSPPVTNASGAAAITAFMMTYYLSVVRDLYDGQNLFHMFLTNLRRAQDALNARMADGEPLSQEEATRAVARLLVEKAQTKN
jgi:hypothetical protein